METTPKMENMDRGLKLPPVEGSGFKHQLLALVQPVLAVSLGILVSLLAVKVIGDSPVLVLKTLWKSAFGSREDLGMTLFYATPLIFTGLSVAVAFQAGLFNIGGEGQLTFGAMAAAWIGIRFATLANGSFESLAPWIASFGAILAGAVWGFIPGWLRARRGSHEVINTIMLNFVAAGLTSYVTLYWLKNPENQNPETAVIPSQFMISKFTSFGDVPLNYAFLIALVVAFLVWVLLWRTSLGYEIRAVGDNEEAARSVGIDSAKIRILAMTLAGGIAGMVGINEVLGNAGKFKVGFSPDYGFIGIAVALLGRNQPLGVVFSAFLFGALHKGASDLDLETEKITRDFSLILQAFIILAVSAKGFWDYVLKPRRKGVK